MENYIWHHQKPARNQRNDASKLNERTDADPIVTMLRELMQNLVDAEKVSEDHLVEIKLFSDTRSNHHMETILGDVRNRSYISSKNADGTVKVNSTMVVHERGYAGLTGPLTQIRPFNDAQPNDHFHNFFFVQSKRTKVVGSGGGKGIGKITYFLASEARSVFVAANRHGEKEQFGLFGMSEHEQVYEFEETDWDFLSYWSHGEAGDSGDYSGACTKQDIDIFLDPFGISRSSSYGNSWIIPGVDEEKFSEHTIIRTIIEQYYTVILNDELRVKVGEIEIKQGNLDALVSEYVPELEEELNFIQETMTASNLDYFSVDLTAFPIPNLHKTIKENLGEEASEKISEAYDCLLYTSPSPRDAHESRMPSSA